MQTLKPLRRHMAHFQKRRFLEHRMAVRFGKHGREFRLIMHAADAIRDTHRGKGRRKNEESKLVHEREMAGIADFYDVDDWIVYVAIFTHDGPEDYRKFGWSFNRICRDYGRSACRNVRALTNPNKSKGINDHHHHKDLANQWRAGGRRVVLVKSYDRLHGLLTPWPGGRIRMEKKMLLTIRYLLPIMVEFGLDTYPLITAIGMLQRRYGLHNLD